MKLFTVHIELKAEWNVGKVFLIVNCIYFVGCNIYFFMSTLFWQNVPKNTRFSICSRRPNNVIYDYVVCKLGRRVNRLKKSTSGSCAVMEEIENLFPRISNTTSTRLKHIVFGLQDYCHSIFCQFLQLNDALTFSKLKF